MGLGADLRAFKAKNFDGRANRIVRETVLTFAESLVTTTPFNGPWTPYGDPALWKHPPPADYVPGNARSSWFLSIGSPSGETTERTDILRVNHLDALPEKPAGLKVYISNSAPHIGALETGHSQQAPVGILVNAAEFTPMVNFIARQVGQ
jgi:hypothetical protein